MNVQVALVHVDRRYWLDRRIAKLRGGQKYSHAALLLHLGDSQVMWVDVHWRWFTSDLREIPIQNYSWDYQVFDILGCNTARSSLINSWVQDQKSGWVNYDLFGAILMPFQFLRLNSPRSFTCFEFITRALMKAGYVVEYDPEKALASDLLQSGILIAER